MSTTMTIRGGYSGMTTMLVREISATRKQYGEQHGRRPVVQHPVRTPPAVVAHEVAPDRSQEFDAERWDGLA